MKILQRNILQQKIEKVFILKWKFSFRNNSRRKL